jgi:chromosome partitioning protein
MSDRALILVFGGQKGGIGKSTQATNFAVEFASQGADVFLVDTDPQKTTVNWFDRRSENEDIKPLKGNISAISKEGNVRETINDASSRYDVVIVDAAGRDSKSLRTAMTLCDKIICPIRPSQADLETIPYVSELIDTAKDINENIDAYCLVSMAPTHPFNDESSSAAELLESYSEYFKLLKSFVKDRKVYRDALLDGYGVVEMSNEKAKNEFKKVFDEVIND